MPLGGRRGRVRTYVVAEGTSRLNRFVFRGEVLTENVLWYMHLQQKYQRWPWWRLSPPEPITTVRFIDVGPWSRAGAWLLTVVAILEAVKRR